MRRVVYTKFLFAAQTAIFHQAIRHFRYYRYCPSSS